MKIASVTFRNPIYESGGATVPAFAFKDWCDLYNFECDIKINPRSDELHEYDYIFFATPPLKELPFNWHDIKKPFSVMIHVENDLNIYNLNCFKHKNCHSLITIDENYRGFDNLHKNIIIWYPCCRIKYLSIPINPSSSNSIVYAGRITHWKNAHIAKRLGAEIHGRIDDFNYAEKHNIKSSQYVESEISEILKRHGLFFSICGNEKNKMLTKRIDLACVEAIHHGLMPVVNKNAIPELLKGAFIEVDLESSDDDIKGEILNYLVNKSERWAIMLKKYGKFLSIFSDPISKILGVGYDKF